MTQAHRRARSVAIDARVRARRVAGYQVSNRFARMGPAQYARDRRFLDELASRVACGTFTAAELCDARAVLIDGDPTAPQQSLPIRSRGHA